MANVTETPSYDAGIYQIETTDPVLGGPNGIANAQAKGLANRTAFLKQQIDQLNSGQLTPNWIASQTYVQEQLQKLDAKQSVRAATVANITLSGVQTIDGVVLTVGERVLVKDQTAAAQNGIYLVAAQSWTRATDADDDAKLNSGARIAVEGGDINAGKVWYLATIGAISVGSTALLFVDEHPSATETVKGVTRYATQAEVDEQIEANQKDDAVVTVKKLWAWVKQASETVLGMMKVATQAQTNAGTLDNVAITPKKLRAGFVISTGANGYIAFPTWMGGLIIQWFSFTPTSTAQATLSFPIVFPNNFLAFLSGTAGSGGATIVRSGAITASTVQVTSSNTGQAHFIVVLGF
ncbi:gp53-like domain-containing protein [Aeromonas hydrophila]|uniref:gp53-like domain-containing protein n=1 Tax=Aeromonas hydrophila TaxID=644 RepID=UPI001FC8B74D|nr:hypothetical protein [Aeromonas hydrophila]GKQ95959.1 hypothetical protein KAM461_02090 [Aeromonas hydrophila]